MNHKCIQIIFLVFLLSTLTACNGQLQADLVEAVNVAGNAAEIDAAGEAEAAHKVIPAEITEEQIEELVTLFAGIKRRQSLNCLYEYLYGNQENIEDYVYGDYNNTLYVGGWGYRVSFIAEDTAPNPHMIIDYTISSNGFYEIFYVGEAVPNSTGEWSRLITINLYGVDLETMEIIPQRVPDGEKGWNYNEEYLVKVWGFSQEELKEYKDNDMVNDDKQQEISAVGDAADDYVDQKTTVDKWMPKRQVFDHLYEHIYGNTEVIEEALFDDYSYTLPIPVAGWGYKIIVYDDNNIRNPHILTARGMSENGLYQIFYSGEQIYMDSGEWTHVSLLNFYAVNIETMEIIRQRIPDEERGEKYNEEYLVKVWGYSQEKIKEYRERDWVKDDK